MALGSKKSWGGPEGQGEREVRGGLREVAVQRDECSAEHAPNKAVWATESVGSRDSQL